MFSFFVKVMCTKFFLLCILSTIFTVQSVRLWLMLLLWLVSFCSQCLKSRAYRLLDYCASTPFLFIWTPIFLSCTPSYFRNKISYSTVEYIQCQQAAAALEYQYDNPTIRLRHFSSLIILQLFLSSCFQVSNWFVDSLW